MKKAGDLLEAFFDDEILKTAKGYSAVFTAWRNIVGERLAAHSHIVELERAILVVEADHPGWIQLLQLEQSRILQNVKKMFPDLEINGISMRLVRNILIESVPEKIKENNSLINNEISNPIMTDDVHMENMSIGDPYDNITDDSFKQILKRLERSIKDKNGNR
jgi:hypothetical protein